MNIIVIAAMAAVLYSPFACAKEKDPFKKEFPVKYVLLSEKGETTITPEQYAGIDDLNRRNIEFTEEEFIDSVKRGDVELVRIFLKSGMNPNTKIEKEWPALALASFKGHAEVVGVLADGKALLNMKNSRGWTPLMLAVHMGRSEAAKTLVEKGADIELTNNMGMTALMLATQQKNLELIALLLKKGADPAVESEFGASAANIAVDSGQVDVLAVFEKAGRKKLLEKVRADNKLEKRKLSQAIAQQKKAKEEVAPKLPPKMPNNPESKVDKEVQGQ